ncbi:MAG: phosphate transport system substrate-binding protein [Solirubrobacterales bacterium]|nr:phosphate transport system substrate-binding protein [Solirubrobacterales bacterium]
MTKQLKKEGIGQVRSPRKEQRMKKKTLAVVVGALVTLSVPASAGAATNLIGGGSVAAQPVLLPLFKAYEKLTKHKVHFIYTANGGNTGAKFVQSGQFQFAGQARPPASPTDDGLTYIKLYLDGLCMDVNPKNNLKNTTLPQVKDIYTAVTTNWGSVPGSGLSTTIDPVGRDTNGGTYTFFRDSVLLGASPASNVNALTADGLVRNAVQRDPNAIGYFGLAWQGRGVKSLTINGIPCAPKQIKKFKYPLSRFIWLVLPTASPNPDLQKFADFVRTSAAAGTIISKAGGVPAFNKKAKKH